MNTAKKIETTTERGLFASRWLLTPFYVGLVGSLALLMSSFITEFIGYFLNITSMKTSDTILAVLTLIDITLAANLVIIVIFSGYENFVSKFDIDEHEDRPAWQGKVDFSGLKMKLVSSIIAISSIHLLKIFMDIQKYDERIVYWMVIIHAVFIVSGVMMALTDRLVYGWQRNGGNGKN